jgi:hypothetical protein
MGVVMADGVVDVVEDVGLNNFQQQPNLGQMVKYNLREK